MAPYRALRVVLGVMSGLVAVGSLLVIFSGKPLLIRMFLHPPDSEISTLLLFIVKEMGGLLLMLAVMLFFAYRDPARNVAIIDALIVGLCILAITPLLSLYTLDIRRLYRGYMIWAARWFGWYWRGCSLGCGRDRQLEGTRKTRVRLSECVKPRDEVLLP